MDFFFFGGGGAGAARKRLYLSKVVLRELTPRPPTPNPQSIRQWTEIVMWNQKIMIYCLRVMILSLKVATETGQISWYHYMHGVLLKTSGKCLFTNLSPFSTWTLFATVRIMYSRTQNQTLDRKLSTCKASS